MNDHDRMAVEAFFAQVDEAGVSNAEKAEKLHHVIRRVPSTPKDRSFEEVPSASDSAQGAGEADVRPSGTDDLPFGVVAIDGQLVGFGIHILNEDVYPLQSFEIYLRGCDLVGRLDLSGCADVVFVDVYRNRISQVDVTNMPALRILGLQDNEVSEIDLSGLPAVQGIDVGLNRIEHIDVSGNPALVELYVNDNRLETIDTSRNPKLKYLRVQNNHLTSLDTTANPLLRHLYATGNPLKSIRALAPRASDDGSADGASSANSANGAESPATSRLLELTADEGGCVGLSFNPIYNAQWKETGEWEQSYHAYPDDGREFMGWYDAAGACVSTEQSWQDEYGTPRTLTARFKAKTLDVVAAVIQHEGKVLATQRGYGNQAGGWEFPGGKIEPGETPEDALVREIREELGAAIGLDAPLLVVDHDYETFHLHMHCFLAHFESGTPQLREHSAAKWLGATDIDSVAWLPADTQVVEAVKESGVLR